MQRLFAFLLLNVCWLCSPNPATAQILNPTNWDFDIQKISETEFDLIATAYLDDGWFMYSQYLANDDGPIRTVFEFKPHAAYQLIGKTQELSEHKKAGFDKMFDMDVIKYSKEIRFVQRVKSSDVMQPIQGIVTYGTCDDIQCLPPAEVKFTYKLPRPVIVNDKNDSQGSIVPKTEKGEKNKTTNRTVATDLVPKELQKKVRELKALAEQKEKEKKGIVIKVAEQVPETTLTTQKGNSNLSSMPNDAFINPVKWQFSSKKVSETEYDVVLVANIEKGWHIYSQFLAPDGPSPTLITLEGVESIGKATEESPEKEEHNDPLFDNMRVVQFSKIATFTQRIKVTDATQPLKGSVNFMSCDEGHCLPPEDVAFSIDLTTGKSNATGDNIGTASTGSDNPLNAFVVDKSQENKTCSNTNTQEEQEKSSLFWTFLLGFGGGFLALLTPCVFPMIPLTVGFFTKRAKTKSIGIRNALIYGVSIIAIYVGLGLVITSIFGADALNVFSTNAWVNIGFGLIFIAFAFSFFGYYEITLPASWSTKTDQAAEKGGLLGIFFMAFTLALVSFSCTGPIIGTLLVETATGGVPLAPLAGMLGFSTALALPFAFFAAFPAWLQSLPKSGSWMTSVKVTLGFVELALALKFFSIADLTQHKKIIPYELMLGVWVLCALGLVLYFMGAFSFKDVNPNTKRTPTQLGIAAVWLVILAYCGLGFRHDPKADTFNTPDLLSGILPPAGHSYIYPKECPLNLDCYHDLEEGLAYAKKVNRPILLDFTGYGCANCRKMEDNVWGKEGVYELIRDKYVLISLYVDDRKPLEKPYISAFSNREIKTVGNKWADFQAQTFNRNSQPYYVLLDNNLKVLNQPVAYTLDIKVYQAFLECGLQR